MNSHQDLLNQIAVWHSAQEHDKIKSAILELPPAERSDELLSLLARALFNDEKFAAALQVLDGIASRCGDEPWC